MTREDVIRMAREVGAGVCAQQSGRCAPLWWKARTFASLKLSAQERLNEK